MVADTSKALADLTTAFDPLSGVFSRVAALSGEAQLELAGLAGGIEALMSKASAYVSNFYSAEEQAALQAQSIALALSKVGLDIGRTGSGGGALDTRDEFRALVNSVNVSTTRGREQLAALLNISGDFAAMTDYLEKSGLTLAQVAGNMPGSDNITRAITEATEAAANAGATDSTTPDAVTLSDEDSTALLEASAGVEMAVDGVTAKLDAVAMRMETALGLLRASIEAGQAAMIAATNATTAQLRQWDDGGALVTTTAP